MVENCAVKGIIRPTSMVIGEVDACVSTGNINSIPFRNGDSVLIKPDFDEKGRGHMDVHVVTNMQQNYIGVIGGAGWLLDLEKRQIATIHKARIGCIPPWEGDDAFVRMTLATHPSLSSEEAGRIMQPVQGCDDTEVINSIAQAYLIYSVTLDAACAEKRGDEVHAAGDIFNFGKCYGKFQQIRMSCNDPLISMWEALTMRVLRDLHVGTGWMRPQ